VVARGDAVVAPSVTRRLLERHIGAGPAPVTSITDLDILTGREREVLALIARGLSNTEIAARLYLTEGTVKTHVSRVLSKLGLRDRVQAVVYAYESGLIRAGAA
jgi:DNA-binding NarL/FixJ family response regulator